MNERYEVPLGWDYPLPRVMGIPLCVAPKSPWVKLKLFVAKSLMWGWGCNEEVVVTVDHKPSMTQPAGALVKDSQGLGVVEVGRGR